MFCAMFVLCLCYVLCYVLQNIARQNIAQNIAKHSTKHSTGHQNIAQNIATCYVLLCLFLKSETMFWAVREVKGPGICGDASRILSPSGRNHCDPLAQIWFSPCSQPLGVVTPDPALEDLWTGHGPVIDRSRQI